VFKIRSLVHHITHHCNGTQDVSYDVRSPPTLGLGFTNLLLEVGHDTVTVAVDSSPQQGVAFFYQSKYVTVQLVVVNVTTSWLADVLSHRSTTALFLQPSHMQCLSNLITIKYQQITFVEAAD